MKNIIIYLIQIIICFAFSYSKKVKQDQFEVGTDSLLMQDDSIGPWKKVSTIVFKNEFENIPQISIQYKRFHVSIGKRKHYSTSVINVTTKGFQIEYEQITNTIFQGEVNWLAFDKDMGEVITLDLDKDSVGDLGEWFTRADEHRLEIFKLNFTKTYSKPPIVLSSIIGCLNDGPEWVINSNATEVYNDRFVLNANAWHHTNVEQAKFNILVIDTAVYDCEGGQGKDYCWTEQQHDWYPHVWNELDKVNVGKDGRYQSYNYKIKSSKLSPNYKKFYQQGFSGYENQIGYLTLNIDDVQLLANNSLSMSVGVHRDTRLPGAWWNYIICDVEKKVEREISIKHFLEQHFDVMEPEVLVVSFIITILFTFIFLYICFGKNHLERERKKIEELKKKNQ